MKRMYQLPAIEIARVQATTGLLTGSSAVDPAPAPGIGAGRSNYGNGGSDTWD